MKQAASIASGRQALTFSPETSVDFLVTTRSYIPKDRILHDANVGDNGTGFQSLFQIDLHLRRIAGVAVPSALNSAAVVLIIMVVGEEGNCETKHYNW
jgi:hypothetical protein